jgi:hypothetical protein
MVKYRYVELTAGNGNVQKKSICIWGLSAELLERYGEGVGNLHN